VRGWGHIGRVMTIPSNSWWLARRTVPNVFVSGTSIGGGDDTTALRRSGKLKEILQAAGAVES
jgi:glutaredoxin-related protein